jgi:hypothetical protein
VTQRSMRDALYQALDDKTSAKILKRVMPVLSSRQPTLLVYNTVSRLFSGDLQHVVTINDVWADLFAFPSEWKVVGLGTTNWLKRNGEMMPDGTARDLNFWWADPRSSPQAHVIDLEDRPEDTDMSENTIVKRQAQFPFLALAVCDPSSGMVAAVEGVDSLHQWLKDSMEAAGIKLAGVQVRGQFGHMKVSDAHYLPAEGLNAAKGYIGVSSDFFRFSEYDGGSSWTINGLYTSDDSLMAFISLPNTPVHLHGYQTETMHGGHVISAEVVNAEVTVWPLTDTVIKISNV